MKIAIGTDHRGVTYKEKIIEHFKDNFEFIDCSKNNFDTDDYPDFAFIVGEKVSKREADVGILLCGTGIGMSIAANKVKGVRCALVHNLEEAKLAKEHNNANVIAMGTSNEMETIYECLSAFLKEVPSDDEKHKRRVQKIINYENREYNEL